MADHTTVEDPLGDYDPGEPLPSEDAAAHPDEMSPFADVPADDDAFGPGPDEPPFDGPDDAPSAPRAAIPAQRGPVPADVREQTLTTWFSVAAAALQNGVPATRAREIITQLRAADPVYRVLGEDIERRCKALLRTVEAILSDVADDGDVWLDQMGVFESNSPSARNLRDMYSQIANTMPATAPESALGGALFACRKTLSRDGAARLVKAIDTGADPEELGKIYGEILPPSAIEGSQMTENPSLAALFDEANNRSELITLSSGFRTLDVALHTRPTLPLGFIRGGQLVVMVAPSGAGKTSTVMGTVMVAMTTDMVRQGHRGRLVFIHNEDETTELFADAGIAPGKRHEHLLERVVAMKTTSRAETVKLFYREVLRAKRLSADSGLPVQLFMPAGFVVDYYQALTDGENSEVEATNKTADMLLYGIANCDPLALATITGVSFQSYTGEAWPEGISGYNLPVLATAQLLLKGNQKPFDPDKDDWRSYSTATSDDTPAWEVRPGDYPLSKLDDIRGSTKIIQHATTIIGLHRSKPRNNPQVGFDDRGYPMLQDTRGYFTILKARYGQNLLVIPMEFNRQRNGGSRAQYIDFKAETAMERAKLTNFDRELFRHSGDCIIPERPRPSRMREMSYRRSYATARRAAAVPA